MYLFELSVTGYQNDIVRVPIYLCGIMSVIADKLYGRHMLFKQYIRAVLPPDRLALDRKHPLLPRVFGLLQTGRQTAWRLKE